MSQVYAGMTDSPPITLPLAVPEQEASIFESADDGTLLVVPEPHRQRDSQSTPTQGVSLRVDEADSATLRDRGRSTRPACRSCDIQATIANFKLGNFESWTKDQNFSSRHWLTWHNKRLVD